MIILLLFGCRPQVERNYLYPARKPAGRFKGYFLVYFLNNPSHPNIVPRV